MKKTLVLACCLALVAVAGFARTSSVNPYWAAIFSAPEESGPAVPAAQEAASRTRGVPGKVICSAAANCAGGSPISCASSTVGDTCQGADRSCPGQQGYVRCGMSYTYCQPACGCTEGATRTTWTGYCCDQGGKEKDKEQCINGQWEYIETVCMGPCGPINPILPNP
jgi:hypothetical protein